MAGMPATSGSAANAPDKAAAAIAAADILMTDAGKRMSDE
jgi:hypothetical protein